DWPVRARKAEALAMHRRESAFEFSERAERYGQCAVGAEVTEMRKHTDTDALARRALASEFLLGTFGERLCQRFRHGNTLSIEQAQYGAAPRRLQIGKSHAVRRQHTRQRTDDHTAY